MINDSARGGIVQNDKTTVAIVPKIHAGILTPELLEKIAQVTRKHNIPIVKITSAQRIALVGIQPEDVENVWQDLGMEVGYPVGDAIHYIQSCPGTETCRLGQRDSLSMAQRLDDAIAPLEIPAKTKIGISGCPLSCGEGAVRDIGLFGKKATGWTITIGGNSGLNARLGDTLAKDLDEDAAVDLVVRLIQYYKENAKSKERMYRFVPRVGLDTIKAALGVAE